MTLRNTSSPVRLVGLMLVSVLVLALTGLFGIWYSHSQTDTALTELGDVTRLIDSARQAQVEFKIQVQEWKNLLLRGQNAEEFTSYTKRFDDQSALVRQRLESVRDSPQLPGPVKTEVGAILAAHEEMLQRYRAAAAQYSTTDPATIFAVDRSVRGLDQKLNTRIDVVADLLVELEARKHAELKTAGESLYRGLRLTSLIVSAITLACAGALAWRSLRTH